MGPALFILLMMIFFPMLDLMGMAASYCSGMYLNVMQVKEAAVCQASDSLSTTGQVQKGVVDNWLQNGVGRFVKTTTPIHTNVIYTAGQTDPQTKITDQFVTVTTTFSCQPFLTIPFWIPVPGLSAPMTFTYSSQAQMENPDNAH
jgi:hypothetical protein